MAKIVSELHAWTKKKSLTSWINHDKENLIGPHQILLLCSKILDPPF